MKRILLLALLLGGVIVVVMLVRAFDARDMAPLKIWHTVEYAEEYRAAESRVSNFSQYLQQEERLFQELEEKVYRQVAADDGRLNRYAANSLVHYSRFSRNWNRSFELIPEPAEKLKGAVLLLHGLTDSPYSMRALAEHLHQRGYHVLVPRMPGHGTTPSALRTVTLDDWRAVVAMAMQHLREALGRQLPIHLGGYSTGGALALEYTLTSLDDPAQEPPQRLLLFSPAVDVTPFAHLSRWHNLLSWLPPFQKFEWQSIGPEFEPFKYNSFPKNVGSHSLALAQRLKTGLSNLDARQLEQWPATLTFQSIADATVSTAAVAETLYRQLPAPRHQLLIYDVNRLELLDGFLKQPAAGELLQWIQQQRAQMAQPYTLTLIANSNRNESKAEARTWHNSDVAPQTEAIKGRWPQDTYSLSHVAIPFSVDDPFYGIANDGSLTLGGLVMRGEKDTLEIPLEQMLRLRYNPFYEDMVERVERFLNR